jgi:alkanesulfonate monooxygenase SsuD/methylene tetrahydromethanopterin reductase-like flavin-dependent oxidoreductase (luciferase family)
VSSDRGEGAEGHPLRFGVFVPQGWKLEFSGWSAADAWARSVELARLAEEVGYDHLWVYDHVETVPRREPTHVFEAFTMLAAIAQHTSKVYLGQLVTCASYRNAGLLAKEAACVDVYSGGRLILGLGAGWYSQEYDSYGYEFLSGRQRLQALDETIQAVRRLWVEERVTFDGENVHLTEALCDPKPIQRLPSIWVGGGGEKVTLRIAARLANATNWQVGLDDFVRKSQLLQVYCDDIGRPFGEITRTHAPDCRIFDTDAEAGRWCDDPQGGPLRRDISTAEYRRNHLVGTPEQVAEQVQGYIDAGCSEFVLWLRDYPSDETLRRFMSEVVPLVHPAAGG